DTGADRNDVGNSGGAQRYQQGQRRFGSVRSGAERVQSEDRDSGRGPEFLTPFIRRLERSSEQQINKRHPGVFQFRLDRNQRIGFILMPTSNPLVRAANSPKCNSEESTGQQLKRDFRSS